MDAGLAITLIIVGGVVLIALIWAAVVLVGFRNMRKIARDIEADHEEFRKNGFSHLHRPGYPRIRHDRDLWPGD